MSAESQEEDNSSVPLEVPQNEAEVQAVSDYIQEEIENGEVTFEQPDWVDNNP